MIFHGEWDQPAAYAETHCDPPRSILKVSIVRKTDRRHPYELTLYLFPLELNSLELIRDLLEDSQNLYRTLTTKPS